MSAFYAAVTNPALNAARRRTDDVVGMSDGKVAELAAAWKRLAA